MYEANIYHKNTLSSSSKKKFKKESLKQQKSDELINDLLLQMRQYQNQQDFLVAKRVFTPVKNRKKREDEMDRKQWQSFILPEVNDCYENIKNGNNFSGLRQNQKNLKHNFSEDRIILKQQRSTPSIISDKRAEQSKQFEVTKNNYVEKIKTLEHQNENLKEELFYLRAALLAQANIGEGISKSQLSIKQEKSQK